MTDSTKALIPFTETLSIGKVLAESGMFPDAKGQAQAVAKILAGQELGFGPVYSLTKIHVIQGKIVTGAEVMAAKIKQSGRYDYRVQEHTNEKCIVVFKEAGVEVYTSTFTMADARTAGLVKPDGNWAKWPKAMLWSRALSQGARIVCPHVIAGIYTFEDFGVETDADGNSNMVISTARVVDQDTGEIAPPQATAKGKLAGTNLDITVGKAPPEQSQDAAFEEAGRRPVSKPMLDRINTLIGQTKTDVAKVKAAFKVGNLADLTAEQAAQAVKTLEAKLPKQAPAQGEIGDLFPE